MNPNPGVLTEFIDDSGIDLKLKSVDSKGEMRDGTESPIADRNQQRTFSLPEGYELMTDEELNKWMKYEINSSLSADDEWQIVKNAIANCMVKELNMYTGREQQMKGVVTSNTQLFVFGTTLPRGHGHRGQLSGFMSRLYYEITGRAPRKRRMQTVISNTNNAKIRRPQLYPQTLNITVIGDSPLARVITQRLLHCRFHVTISNEGLYSRLISERIPSVMLNGQQFLELASLEVSLSTADIILLCLNDADNSELLFVHTNNLFQMISPGKVVFDLGLEDYTTSARIHSIAKKNKIRYYDAPLFPVPTSLTSYAVHPPSIFMGGEQVPEEPILSAMFSLGKAIYPSSPMHGIMNKLLVIHYYALQTQVMNEIHVVAQLFGIGEDKSFGEMLQSQCNPVQIIQQNTELAMKTLKEQNEMRISLDSLSDHLRRYYSLPSPQLPLTTTFCNMATKATDPGFITGPDMTSMWKGMGPTIDVSVPPLIHSQTLGE